MTVGRARESRTRESPHRPSTASVLWCRVSEESARSQLSAELTYTLSEIERLADLISVLRAVRLIDEIKLKNLEAERATAEARAQRLRGEIDALED